MKKLPLKSFDVWLEKVLSYPGITRKELLRKRYSWIATSVSMVVAVILLTGILIVKSELKTLISYLIIILSGYVAIKLVMILVRKDMPVLGLIANIWLIIVTFIFILKLGGIQHSAGLPFIGLIVVIKSYTSQTRRVTLITTILYILSIITAGFLYPWLNVPEEMTTEVNNAISVLNISLTSIYGVICIHIYTKLSIGLERIETKKVLELDEAKTRIFTNITHEFRTPLTIILGMLDLIKKDPEQWIDRGTAKIKENSTNILNLINQTLDISKIESGAMMVHMVQDDIIRHLRCLTEPFKILAGEKHIDLLFETDTNSYIMDHDQEKLSQIITNLISNAIKFTPEYGVISLIFNSPQNDEDRICIEVRDNGSGITEEHLPHIFDRFYSVENDSFQTGSGIGLPLAKELVYLLGGQITVSSSEGKGSEFKVFLPVRNMAPYKDEFKPIIKDGFFIKKSLEDINSHIFRKTGKDERSIILLVEDNLDVIEYLHTILKADYQICVAVDGAEGLAMAIEKVPDIVLSDIMMPVMDGIEMLRKLKNDIRTSHIPVVMLTARADISSKLKGIEKGADAYISKPFDNKELQVILKNLIVLRHKLQEHYVSITLSEIKSKAEANLDDLFMQKIICLMDANIDDDRFGIAEICDALGMSRAQIYRKFKSLTDRTPHDYLRSYRLQKAKELFFTTKLNVSEVAYRTGFKNISHFSRIFAEEFGKNPSEFS